MRTFYQNFRVDQALDPNTRNNTTATSSWYGMDGYDRVVFLVSIGATDTTVDAKVEQAQDSSGTGAKDVSGAAITQLSATDDNKFATIEVQASKLDIANGFDYVRLSVTTGNGTTGAVSAAYAIRYLARSAPITQPSAYAEQVNVAG